MTPYRAMALIEGIEEPDNEDEMLDAAHYLRESGAEFSSPGRVGRNISAILDAAD